MTPIPIPAAYPVSAPRPESRWASTSPLPGIVRPNSLAMASTVRSGVLLVGRPRTAMSRSVMTSNAVVPAAPAAAPLSSPGQTRLPCSPDQTPARCLVSMAIASVLPGLARRSNDRGVADGSCRVAALLDIQREAPRIEAVGNLKGRTVAALCGGLAALALALGGVD